MDIGERIKLAREHAAISKSELARRLGIHPSACIQWETKGGTSPKVEHLIEVAQILDVRFEWLTTGRGQMQYALSINEERPEYAHPEKLLSSDERQLLERYRGLTPRKQRALLELLVGGKGESLKPK